MTIATAENLNYLMGIDHVIRVHADGTVTHNTGEYAPELTCYLTADGDAEADSDTELRRQALAQGWELETGWTGQQAGNAPWAPPAPQGGGAAPQGGGAADPWGAPGVGSDEPPF